MRTSKFGSWLWVIVVVAIGGALCVLVVAQPKPPPRAFSTSDLLITALPGWGIYSGPEALAPQKTDLRGAVAASTIRLMKPPEGIQYWTPADVDAGKWKPVVDAQEWVVRFSSDVAAIAAFKEHYWVQESAWPFPPSEWIRPSGLRYGSIHADDLRIVCDQLGTQGSVRTCFLDGRYEEYYFWIMYQATETDSSTTAEDLTALAEAVHSKMDSQLRLRH